MRAIEIETDRPLISQLKEGISRLELEKKSLLETEANLKEANQEYDSLRKQGENLENQLRINEKNKEAYMAKIKTLPSSEITTTKLQKVYTVLDEMKASLRALEAKQSDLQKTRDKLDSLENNRKLKALDLQKHEAEIQDEESERQKIKAEYELLKQKSNEALAAFTIQQTNIT